MTKANVVIGAETETKTRKKVAKKGFFFLTE